MKIILQKPVDDLGNPGDITEVADGYARNYLIPRGLAIKAEKGALKQAETLTRGHTAKVSKQKGEYEAIASKLGIRLNTILTYRKRAYARLNISSQLELLRLVFSALTNPKLQAEAGMTRQ